MLAEQDGENARLASHQMLLREMWGPGSSDEVQYLRVYASHLRKKLDDDPARPYLVTDPGVRFRLVDRSEDG